MVGTYSTDLWQLVPSAVTAELDEAALASLFDQRQRAVVHSIPLHLNRTDSAAGQTIRSDPR
jgi:hypothetical protein